MSSKAFRPASEGMYDVIVVGGGMAAILTAYRIKSAAVENGKVLNIAIIADNLNSPAFAGTQVVRGIEGFFEPDQRQSEAIDRILRKGQNWLEETIAKNNIECRFSKGYELKGLSREQLIIRRESNETKNIYLPGEIVENTDNQSLELIGYPSSFRMECAGQVNIPELLDGMLNEFKKLGGIVIMPATYYSHNYDTIDGAILDTSAGTFKSIMKPIIATGCDHMLGLPDFPVENSETVYTMAMTFGPLEEIDARKISQEPVAFCNVPGHQNMLWGSLDSKNMLTLGYGEVTDPEMRSTIESELLSEVERFYPGITQKYSPQIKFGSVMYTPNLMPVVGETKNSFLMTGWGGRGCVPAAAAAAAIERALRGDRAELKLFEDLQMGAFNVDKDQKLCPINSVALQTRDLN